VWWQTPQGHAAEILSTYRDQKLARQLLSGMASRTNTMAARRVDRDARFCDVLPFSAQQPGELQLQLQQLEQQYDETTQELRRRILGLRLEQHPRTTGRLPGARCGCEVPTRQRSGNVRKFIFVNNWLNPEKGSGKAWVKTEVMLEANTTNSASYANFTGGTGNDQFRLHEVFVRGGNFFSAQPDAKF
jgi:hypothetical protein